MRLLGSTAKRISGPTRKNLNFAAKFLTLKNALGYVRNFLRLTFPSSRAEWLLFSLFFVGYGIIGTTIALNYTIIFDDRIPWDAYFSFDNRAIVLTGGGFERHPLSNYFFEMIREFALLFSGERNTSTFRIVLALLSNLTISLSIVLVYKYLSKIILLPFYISFLLSVFFGFFSTNILLSFTPENYTYTLLLLLLFNLYAGSRLQQDKKIGTLPLALAGISVGGLTITNIVKVYLPVLFERNLFKTWKYFGNAVWRVTLSVVVFVLLFLYRINLKYEMFFEKTEKQYEKFSNPKDTPIWDMIVSWFFGGNVLFSGFITRDYHNKKGFNYEALFMDVYTGLLPYVFIFLLVALILWSYFKNFKNKLVQILMLSFVIDIIIHCVLKFGLHTAYIYGGHFVFVYPLLIGWLFYAYRHSAKVLSFLTLTVSIMLVYLVLNNFLRMQEFFDFLNTYYR